MMRKFTKLAKKGDETDKKVGALFEKIALETEMLVTKKIARAK